MREVRENEVVVLQSSGGVFCGVYSTPEKAANAAQKRSEEKHGGLDPAANGGVKLKAFQDIIEMFQAVDGTVFGTRIVEIDPS